MTYGRKEKTNRLKVNRPKGKEAEQIAKTWLENKDYEVNYWHENKASNLPYDIICYKGKNGYIIDVKSGKNASISLLNFVNLLNKPIEEIRKETRNSRLRRINRIGYIFVINNNCFLLEYNKGKYIADKAVKKRKARSKVVQFN